MEKAAKALEDTKHQEEEDEHEIFAKYVANIIVSSLNYILMFIRRYLATEMRKIKDKKRLRNFKKMVNNALYAVLDEEGSDTD